MRIVHLTPGSGSFHCGSCLRDNALVKALRQRGHDVLMVPLYLPLVTDDEPASPEVAVRVGGINLYLHERFPALARVLPHSVRRFLDHHSRLRAASRRVGMTSPRDLGRMTLGSLRGKDGNQYPEWRRLIDWLAQAEEPPELVSLSNSLLAGLVPMIQESLGCPVLVSLQGEDSFLDALPDPYREECWGLLADLADQADVLVAPSAYYAAHMADRFLMDKDELPIVPPGLDWSLYRPSDPPPHRESATIGFLGRMVPGKGIGNLVDAFLLLRERGTIPGLELHLAGATTESDKPCLDGLRRRIDAAGAAGEVRWSPNLELQEKVDFLYSITVFSMPAPSEYGEAFGLPLIEAMACGAPVVQPEHGAYPEIIGQTGGGIVFPVDDNAALADALERVLLDPELLERLAAHGREAVLERFSAARAAKAFEAVALGCLGAE